RPGPREGVHPGRLGEDPPGPETDDRLRRSRPVVPAGRIVLTSGQKTTGDGQEMNIGRIAVAAVALITLGAVGCGENKSSAPNIAPTSSALAAPKPAAMGSLKFTIDKASTKVDFMMEAPQEKIRGRVPNATVGDLNVNLD